MGCHCEKAGEPRLLAFRGLPGKLHELPSRRASLQSLVMTKSLLLPPKRLHAGGLGNEHLPQNAVSSAWRPWGSNSCTSSGEGTPVMACWQWQLQLWNWAGSSHVKHSQPRCVQIFVFSSLCIVYHGLSWQARPWPHVRHRLDMHPCHCIDQQASNISTEYWTVRVITPTSKQRASLHVYIAKTLWPKQESPKRHNNTAVITMWHHAVFAEAHMHLFWKCYFVRCQRLKQLNHAQANPVSRAQEGLCVCASWQRQQKAETSTVFERERELGFMSSGHSLVLLDVSGCRAWLARQSWSEPMLSMLWSACQLCLVSFGLACCECLSRG